MPNEDWKKPIGKATEESKQEQQESEQKFGTENPEYPLLKIPQDLEKLQKLESKLAEYKQRLATKLGELNLEYTAPEVIFAKTAGTEYKIAIVERLLRTGRVTTKGLSRELHKKDGNFDEALFNDCCGVIEDYCNTGGANVSGGIGF